MKRRYCCLCVLVLIAVARPAVAQDSAVARADTTAVQYGTVRFEGLTDSVFVVVDLLYQRATAMGPQDSVRIPAGKHFIAVYQLHSSTSWSDVAIVPGGVTTLKGGVVTPAGPREWYAFPRMYWRANLLVITDGDSEIYLGEKRVGRGVAWVDTTVGEYTISTRHARAGHSEARKFLGGYHLTKLTMYNKMKVQTARSLTAIPGARQIYMGETTKGSLILLQFVAGWSSALYYRSEYHDRMEDYGRALSLSRSAGTALEAQTWRNEADVHRIAADNAGRYRTFGIVAGLSAIVLHVIDLMQSPPMEPREEIFIDPYDIPAGVLHPDEARLKVSWRF